MNKLIDEQVQRFPGSWLAHAGILGLMAVITLALLAFWVVRAFIDWFFRGCERVFDKLVR